MANMLQVAGLEALRAAGYSRAMQQAYERRLADGELKPDAAQAAVVARLQALASALAGAKPPRWAFWKKPPAAPRGLYLWGDVGRGKTLLMDMFFAHVRVHPKRRIHFNDFMQDVHARVAARRAKTQAADVIAPVARAMAQEMRLLCLDEFQVQDITDAMLLGRLFEALLAAGVTIIVTSNTQPAELYRDGLNRQLFLPFIALIESRLDVVALHSPTDHRLGRVAGRPVYLTGRHAKARMESLWHELTDGAAGEAQVLKVKGRELIVPRAAHGAAFMDFDALCGRPLGTADYLALAQRFSTLFLAGVPVLKGAERRNEARRFTLLVDTLYDRGIRLVISAKAPAGELGVMARTLSRLKEMASAAWWQGKSGRKNAKT